MMAKPTQRSKRLIHIYISDTHHLRSNVHGYIAADKVRRACSRERSYPSLYTPLHILTHTHDTFRLPFIPRSRSEIEAEMARTQKNKATEYHLGRLKMKLAKLKVSHRSQ
jgi:hypothetical protein